MGHARSMPPLPGRLAPLFAALGLLAAPLSPQADEVPPDIVTKPFVRPLQLPGKTGEPQLPLEERLEQIEVLEKEIQGAWTLNRFLPGGSHNPIGPARGFAIFRDGYATIVIHAVDNTNLEDDSLYQTGVLHYRIDENLRLQTATIIGHSNFGGNFGFEERWTPREFRIRIAEQIMVLERPDGARLQFLHAGKSAFPEGSFDLMREASGRADADRHAKDFLEKADRYGGGPDGLLTPPTAIPPKDEVEVVPPEGRTGPFLDRKRGPLLPDGPMMGIRNRRAQADKLSRELNGAWRLVRVIDVDNPIQSALMAGFAMITDGYISFVIEAEANAFDAFDVDPLFQVGVHHLRFNQMLQLQTSTIIGHSNLEGTFSYEEAGILREFEVTVLGNTLTLLRPNGSRLLFQRAENAVFPEKTISLIRQQRMEQAGGAEPAPAPEGAPEVSPVTTVPSPYGSTNRQE